MKAKNNIMIPTNWAQITLDEIGTLHGKGKKYASRSQTIRECTKIGIQVLNHQEMMKDPKKSDAFLQKMQEMIKAENYNEWLQTLQSGQLDGFIMMLQMEKEKRYDQKTIN